MRRFRIRLVEPVAWLSRIASARLATSRTSSTISRVCRSTSSSMPPTSRFYSGAPRWSPRWVCLRRLGIRDDQLDNICNDFVIETYELEAGIHEILETYDRTALSYEQQISYDSYSWILEGWAVEHEWMYHFYPVTHGFSRQNDLFRFFEDEHPLETLQNAEDYISRLETGGRPVCVPHPEPGRQRGSRHSRSGPDAAAGGRSDPGHRAGKRQRPALLHDLRDENRGDRRAQPGRTTSSVCTGRT